MTSHLKSLLLKGLQLPVVTGLFAPFMHDRCTIFMLHRFMDPERGVRGHDPLLLRRLLERLRKDRYRLMPLRELTDAVAAGAAIPARVVVFTIDDGYADQAEIGAPVFAAYDCPVTTFVSSGFLDRQLWFWWDQIEFVFRHTTRSVVALHLGKEELVYSWRDAAERTHAQVDFTARCKRVPDGEKQSAIRRLAAAAEVLIPAVAPQCYAPMTWGQLRECERGGMTFGPHTVTHPILSRTTDAQAEREIRISWERLRAEAQNPVPVFCYPNGQHEDFGSREIAILRNLGIAAAVVGESGFVDVTARAHADAPYAIRRFGYPNDLPRALQYVSGIERAKQLVRREA